MVKSDFRILALYIYFNGTGISWGGETLCMGTVGVVLPSEFTRVTSVSISTSDCDTH